MAHKNPHDKLFKYTLSIKSEAVALVRNFLSEDLKNKLDFRTFKTESNSYINGSLQEYFSDTVWSCRLKTGEQVKVAFLLEHKSYFDKNVIVQFLRYLTEAYDTMLNKEKAEEATLLIPILVYHGRQSWTHRNLADLLNVRDESLLRFVPTFALEFVNIMTTEEEKIAQMREGYLLRSAFLLFQNAGNPDYIWQEIRQLFFFARKEELSEEEIRSFVRALTNYINRSYKFNAEESEKYTNMIKEIVFEADEYLPGSTYEQALLQGRKEGIKEGEKKTSVIKDLMISLSILQKFPSWSNREVSDLAEVPEHTIKKIRKILKENEAEKAYTKFLQTFFKNITLSEANALKLRNKIAVFYPNTDNK